MVGYLPSLLDHVARLQQVLGRHGDVVGAAGGIAPRRLARLAPSEIRKGSGPEMSSEELDYESTRFVTNSRSLNFEPDLFAFPATKKVKTFLIIVYGQ